MKKTITIAIETEENSIPQALESVLYWAKSALHENIKDMHGHRVNFKLNGDQENAEMCDHVIQLNRKRLDFIKSIEQSMLAGELKVED